MAAATQLDARPLKEEEVPFLCSLRRSLVGIKTIREGNESKPRTEEEAKRRSPTMGHDDGEEIGDARTLPRTCPSTP